MADEGRARNVRWTLLLLIGGLVATGAACSGPAAPTRSRSDASSPDDNVLLGNALSYDGTVTGKAVETRNTRESLTAAAAGQALPPTFDVSHTAVRVQDIAGGALLAADGSVIDEIPLNDDGSFSLAGLPVGVDFALCVDIGKDGTCELESFLNIPADEEGATGTLEGVRIDPLTTLVIAKFRQMLEERGIEPQALPISPVAVVSRIVNAYTHLFEESGIEHEVNLEDVEFLAREQLAELFDTFIPTGVRTGMHIVEGNLDAAIATDAETLALSAAKVFLRAGFPISDAPGGLDLSPLGELDGVTAVAAADLFGPHESPGEYEDEFSDTVLDEYTDEIPPELLEQYPDGIPPELLVDYADEIPPDLLDELPDDLIDGSDPDSDSVTMADLGPPPDETIYLSDTAEPDRNFANAPDRPEDEDALPPMPILNDHVLLEMARLQLDGRRVTLGDVHEVLTSLEEGLGARLTYFIHDPNYFGPPLDVFETADGQGKAINLGHFFDRIFEEGLDDVAPEDFEATEGRIRALLIELLSDTVPPTFDALFNGFIRERIAGIEDLAQAVRQAGAHLPFNNTGASTFFVVADGDPFRSGEAVSAITIDAEVTPDGDVVSVTYNEDGNGRFYLGFSPDTESDGSVELLVRETGRFLHGRNGPVRVSLRDETLFGPVNGRPFFDFVSEAGIFFPGTQISIISDTFVPESTDEDMPGPNQQLYVLATHAGPEAEPVRVDYDRATGVATYNPAGRNLLMFLPDSHETGVFALFNEDTGRPASAEDPTGFFEPPPEQPDGFEDDYNEFPDDGTVPPPPDDEPLPPPDDEPLPPPPDDELLPPPDGDLPPPDEEPPPPDDEPLPPPDEEPLPPPEAAPLPPPDEEPPPEDEDPLSDPADIIDGSQAPPPDGGFIEPSFVLVPASEIVGLTIRAESFTHVFGTEVPNDRYDSASDPYFDDVNGNGTQDVGEPTVPYRPTLFDPNDWRSTDIRLYYRRADNGQAVSFDEIDFESERPRTFDGADLVPRRFLPRLNAYRFGRPNTAINMLTAFMPPDFIDGQHGLTRDTEVDVFSAVAVINLVMDQVLNVEANIDIDGAGPLARTRMLVDAHIFVAPIGDPFRLITDGLAERSFVADDQP